LAKKPLTELAGDFGSEDRSWPPNPRRLDIAQLRRVNRMPRSAKQAIGPKQSHFASCHQL
jgi:hypothetical protein